MDSQCLYRENCAAEADWLPQLLGCITTDEYSYVGTTELTSEICQQHTALCLADRGKPLCTSVDIPIRYFPHFFVVSTPARGTTLELLRLAFHQ